MVKFKHYYKKVNGMMLKPIKNTLGYHMVSLHNGTIPARKEIHRLVAEAFIDNTYNKPCVNHKDETRDNNNAYNLEWVTVLENANYGTRNKRISEKAKKKITQHTLEGILVGHYDSQIDIEEKYGYKQPNISMCCRGIKKHAYGFKWSYT